MPARTIIHGEALAWMAENAPSEDASVVTSLPDLSERSDLDFEGWKAWFVLAARRVIAWTPPRGVAVFFQSDIRHEDTLVDKSYLVMRAAEEEGASLLWHKIVCRRPPGTISFGRPSPVRTTLPLEVEVERYLAAAAMPTVVGEMIAFRFG